MRRIYIFLLLLTAIFSSVYSQQKRTQVAVLEFQTTGGLEKREVSTLTNRFRNMLVQTKVFDVVEREKMNEILKTQDFNISDACNTAECAVQVGQLLGVEVMIAGDIGKIGNLYTVDLRMIDVATGKIQRTSTEDYKGDIEGLLGVMGTIANAFAGVETKATAPSGTGDLNITSVPSKAEIYIDGKKTPWSTPRLIEGISAGNHTIELKSGNLSAKRDVVVKKEGIESVDLRLVAASLQVKVLSNPEGAAVYVDNVLSGQAPLVVNVTPGSHQIKISMTGFDDHIETLNLKSGESGATVNAQLKKLYKLSIVPGGPALKKNPKVVIFVDDRQVGKGAATLSLPEGVHTVAVRTNSKDIEDVIRQINLTSDQTLNVELDFTADYKDAKNEKKQQKLASAGESKPMNKKLWYIIGGVAVLGGGTAAVLLSGGGGGKKSTIPDPPGLPTD
jgi:TolB-like protein